MTEIPRQFEPDYAVPPGQYLVAHLVDAKLSHAEFARRCGRSPKLISEIIAGKAPIEPATALQFERVLGVDASFWLAKESDYQLYLTRQAEAENAAEHQQWVNKFPVRELVKRGVFESPESSRDAVSKMLEFFSVASVEAWTAHNSIAKVAYRHSPSFESNDAALATWLRLGEIEAESIKCEEFDRVRFRHALRTIRKLTRKPISTAWPRTGTLCNESGVALVLVKPLRRTALSGAAWWINPRKAVIQLSLRHKSDDHLWFSFFHEAAHVLLHSKRGVFVDGVKEQDDKDEQEQEADTWAKNALITRSAWNDFLRSVPSNEHDVTQFAKAQGIAPGIIVGRLQHERRIPWNKLNHLKVKLDWSS